MNWLLLFSLIILINNKPVDCASKQFLLKNTFHIGYSIEKGDEFIEYHEEYKYLQFSMMKTYRKDEIIYRVPYKESKTLKYNYKTKECEVEDKPFSTYSVAPAFNSVVTKGVLSGSAAPFRITFENSNLFFNSKTDDGYYYPIYFNGLGLEDGVEGIFFITSYENSTDLFENFKIIPETANCTKTHIDIISFAKKNYLVEEFSNDNKKKEIIIVPDYINNKIFLREDGKANLVMANAALHYSFKDDKCLKTRLNILKTDCEKYDTAFDLMDKIWDSVLVPFIKFDILYDYPEITDTIVTTNRRLISDVISEVTIFLNTYKDVQIGFEGNLDSERFTLVIYKDKSPIITYRFNKADDANLDYEIRNFISACNSEESIDDILLISDSSSPRESYVINNIDTVYNAIADQLSSDIFKFDKYRLSNIKAKMVDNKLILNIQLFENEKPKSTFYEIVNTTLKNEPLFQYNGTTKDNCILYCYSKEECNMLVFDNVDMCKLYNTSNHNDHIHEVQDSLFIYMPYIKEIGNNDGRREYEKKPEIVINLSGNFVKVAVVLDNLKVDTLDFVKGFESLYVKDDSLELNITEEVDSINSIFDCAKIVDDLAKFSQVQGFYYDMSKDLCSIAGNKKNKTQLNVFNNDPSIQKFNRRTYKMYDMLMTIPIQEELEKTNLIRIETKDLNECSSYCYDSSDIFCSGFYQCQSTCYITSSIVMDNFKHGDVIDKNQCSLYRVRLENMLLKTYVYIKKANLNEFLKTNYSDNSLAVVIENPDYDGFVIETTSNNMYYVDKSNIKYLYQSKDESDIPLSLIYYEKRENKRWIKDEITIVEEKWIGLTSGVISAIVICTGIVAFMIAFGLTYLFKENTNSFDDKLIIYNKKENNLNI